MILSTWKPVFHAHCAYVFCLGSEFDHISPKNQFNHLQFHRASYIWAGWIHLFAPNPKSGCPEAIPDYRWDLADLCRASVSGLMAGYGGVPDFRVAGSFCGPRLDPQIHHSCWGKHGNWRSRQIWGENEVRLQETSIFGWNPKEIGSRLFALFGQLRHLDR